MFSKSKCYFKSEQICSNIFICLLYFHKVLDFVFMSLSEKEIQKHIEKVGKRIVEFRKEKNLKQYELAYDIDILDSALRRIEKGRTNPTLKTLLLIANALDISVDELVKP